MDRTVVAFRALASDARGGPPIVMVRRETRDPGDTLRAHATRRVLELSGSLRDFEFREAREMEVGGQNAVYVRCTWSGDAAPLEQALAVVETPHPPRVLTIAMTASWDQTVNARESFAQVLATVAFQPSRGQKPLSSLPTPASPSVPCAGSLHIPIPGAPATGLRGATMRYDADDVSFELPGDWIDCSIVSACAPPASNITGTLLMTLEPLRTGHTLREHADEHLSNLGRHLGAFDLVESRETTVARQPAIHMRFTWRGHHETLEQSLTMFERANAAGRHVVTFVTATSARAAPVARWVFARIIDSVALDSPTETAEAPAPYLPLPEIPIPRSYVASSRGR
jgi:hypothetical protein